VPPDDRRGAIAATRLRGLSALGWKIRPRASAAPGVSPPVPRRFPSVSAARLPPFRASRIFRETTRVVLASPGPATDGPPCGAAAAPRGRRREGARPKIRPRASRVSSGVFWRGAVRSDAVVTAAAPAAGLSAAAASRTGRPRSGRRLRSQSSAAGSSFGSGRPLSGRGWVTRPRGRPGGAWGAVEGPGPHVWRNGRPTEDARRRLINVTSRSSAQDGRVWNGAGRAAAPDGDDHASI